MQYLHKYVKNRKGQLTGVVLSTKTAVNQLGIGWSKCHKNDSFDKERGVSIALCRAISGSKVPFPHGFAVEVKEITNRGQRYFKI
jgi:hypothetical protein